MAWYHHPISSIFATFFNPKDYDEKHGTGGFGWGQITIALAMFWVFADSYRKMKG
jgi:hypothetical protein